QDQYGALIGRQVLERRGERELYPLALVVARFGCRVPVLEPDQLVRVGLDPHRLDRRAPGRLIRRGGRAVVDREHALWSPLDLAEAGVGGDRVQPRSQRAAALEAADA